MLDQLLPIVRFDGYFILSDLIGVPDLFARVVPIVKSALPAGRRDPRVAGLLRHGLHGADAQGAASDATAPEP